MSAHPSPARRPGTRLLRTGALWIGVGVAGVGMGLVAPAPSQASSPQAWEAYGRQVLQACRAASQLRQPAPAGERVDLPSASGSPTSVLVLRGTYPQAHMAGRQGLEVCLYDSRTKQARVGEADRLIGPSRP